VTIRAGALILDLARREGAACAGCGAVLCGHAVLCATVLGFRDAPRCLACLADPLGMPPARLHQELVAHVQRRDCFLAAWQWTSAREGPCPAAGVAADAAGSADAGPGACAATPAGDAERSIVPEAEWDAGEMACGDLVLELRLRLRQVVPGGILLVTAHDVGAPEDLPAWCRLTRNPLAWARHPVYCIRRRAADAA